MATGEQPPVVIRVLGPDDAELVRASGDEVFDSTPEPSLTAEFLADPRHHIVGALMGGRIVGMATAVDYVHPDKPSELWINEVGVAEPFQRQGIAQKLMQALFEHGRSLGCAEAWVLTETDNTAARALYSAVGGKEEMVAYLTFKI